jgi:hypothetical protein
MPYKIEVKPADYEERNSVLVTGKKPYTETTPMYQLVLLMESFALKL